MPREFERQELERIFHMYKPSAVYLDRARIEFPRLEAGLIFPETPIYLNEGLGIQHINNTEVEIIVNQGMFLFYRQAMLDGALDFPKIPKDKLQEHYDRMFIKQEIDYYERFTLRDRKDLVLKLEHSKTRKIGNAQLVWCNMFIPEFMKVEVIGGLKFD